MATFVKEMAELFEVVLTEPELKMLERHKLAGTHVCCGTEWTMYTDGDGGG